MKILTVELKNLPSQNRDLEGQRVLQEIKDFGIKNIKNVSSTRIYKFEGIKNLLDLQAIKSKLLIEPVWLKEANGRSSQVSISLEISLKEGVTNTEIDSILKAIHDLGIGIKAGKTARKYFFEGHPTKKDLAIISDKILMNKTIEKIVDKEEKTFIIKSKKPKTEVIHLSKLNEEELINLSHERLLFLSLEEIKTIQKYFISIGRNPTDCELEILAQTWSEHNFHKTFKTPLIIDHRKKKPFMERIKQTTQLINHKDALVTFSDNAGIVSFDKNFCLAAKTETHNSPSAIEPYGGAMTGSGGVFRDIAAAGLGARNIASTDIFCFAPPTLAQNQVPQGCLHPKRIMQKCILGVRHYGNCMGIPTVNGSLSFHPDYRAKPVVLVGAYGILPKKYIHKKKIKKGDLIVTVGGKTGRDGIHGATFSSGQMSGSTDTIAASAVQIGNPIEEIRMFDALIEARNKGLIKNITDCGGGGYSSAIGEMAKDIGALVDLAKVPLKYQGLSNWEIFLSESQERMIVALNSKHLKAFQKICQKYNTGVWEIGKFTGNKRLEIVAGKDRGADLNMQFLHYGLPKKILVGKYRKKQSTINYQLSIKKKFNYSSILKKVLSNLNVASKEEIVRRYDHEVQGRLALKPFLGVYMDSPTDGAIIKPLFNSAKGLAISSGLNIGISKIDPYWGAISAVDEAIRNIVAIGTNPQKIFLLDNYIFPKPDKYVLAELHLTPDGHYQYSKIYGTPIISGPDSLSGTYVHGNLKINVPPTVCVSALGIVDDIKNSISPDFKSAGNLIIHLGQVNKNLGGSILSSEMKFKDNFSKFDIKKASILYLKLYQAMKKGLILSCHDISEGGLIVTLSEMCFGGDCGAKINIIKDPFSYLFSESAGRFLIEIRGENIKNLKKIFINIPIEIIGKVIEPKKLIIKRNKKNIINQNILELKKYWQKPFKKYF